MGCIITAAQLLLIVGSCVLGGHTLLGSSGAARREKSHAAGTIALFTGLYLLLNLPYFLLTSSLVFSSSAYLALQSADIAGYLHHAAYMCVPLNAALNSVLYLARMPAFTARVYALIHGGRAVSAEWHSSSRNTQSSI